MNDLSVADVHGNMVNGSFAIGIENQITWTHITGFDPLSCIRLFSGYSRNTNTKIPENRLGKAGAICSIRQTGSAPYIWVTDKFQRIIDDLASQGRLLVCSFLHR